MKVKEFRGYRVYEGCKLYTFYTRLCQSNLNQCMHILNSAHALLPETGYYQVFKVKLSILLFIKVIWSFSYNIEHNYQKTSYTDVCVFIARATTIHHSRCLCYKL